MNSLLFKCCARDNGVYPSLLVSLTKFFNPNSSQIYFVQFNLLFFTAKCNILSLFHILLSNLASYCFKYFKTSKVYSSEAGPAIANKVGVAPEYSLENPNLVFFAFFSIVMKSKLNCSRS